MASEIRVNKFINRSGLTTTTLTDTGVTIAGILTVSENLNVGGVLTYEDVTNVDSIGILTARTDINLGDSIIHIGDTNTKIRFPSNDTISFETGGGERLRITSEGKVGIGTDVFGATKLDIFEPTGTNSTRSLVRFQKDHTSTSVTGSTGAVDQYPHALILENQDNSADTGTVSLAFSKYSSGVQSQAIIAGIQESAGNMALTLNTESGNTIYERLRIRSDGKVQIGTQPVTTSATFNVKGNAVFDDGTNARLTLQAENNNTNQILSTTTNFGSYTTLKYMAADHKFQYGGNELVRIHAISKGIQVYGGDLLLGPDSVSQMEATIRAWGCSLWFTTIDPNYYHDSGGEFRQFYNKGSFRGDNYLTAFNCPIQTGIGPQSRNFWRGANADTRAEGSLDIGVGYRGAFFFIGQTSCASIPYQGSGRYLYDSNSPTRISVSFDAFGNGIDSGELSFYAGGNTAGYDSGNGTVGGRLGSSNTDSTLRMYCVGVNMENYNAPNSKRAGNHLGISVINNDGTDFGSSRLSENLINNGQTGGGNQSQGEFNWGNRHSNDRGGTTTFRHSQLMYFDDVQLNSAQWDYLEHYFKVMYG